MLQKALSKKTLFTEYSKKYKAWIAAILTMLAILSIGYFLRKAYGNSHLGNILLFIPAFPVLYKICVNTIGTGTRRDFWICGSLGGFFAITYSVGSLTEGGGVFVYSAFYVFKVLCCVAVLTVAFYYVVLWLFRKLQRIQEKCRAITFSRCKGNFFFVWGLVFLCWVPWLVVFLPGVFAYDVPWQLQYYFTGVYNAHHPLLHTLYLGACIQLGQVFFGSTTAGGVYTV